MSTKTRNKPRVQATVETAPVTPAVETAPVTPAVETAPVTPAAVKARYAAPASINNMAAVITAIPNPKVPGKKSHARYAKFYVPGITVQDFIASYKAAGYSTTLARADLRWDLQHGFITLS
jgi:hypothetical protein